jgi:hypothetical protein
MRYVSSPIVTYLDIQPIATLELWRSRCIAIGIGIGIGIGDQIRYAQTFILASTHDS